MKDVSCPCCGEPMDRQVIVCGDCWIDTHHGRPGTHRLSGGKTVHLTTTARDRWEWLKNERNRG